jgi:hypothetical protein
LKDEGFPGSELWEDVNGIAFKSPTPGPTLEELIEACGENFEGVRKVTIEFDHTHYWLAETDNSIACKGLSHTEAVAKLWLALNPKKA